MKCQAAYWEAGATPTRTLTRVGCFALGAAATYLLDPDRGARRRGVFRDKVFSGFRQAGEAAAKTAEYSRDRSRGVVAETAARLRPDDAGDEVIVERVRSAIGRAVSHPRAIEVQVRNGVATLGGPVLKHEVDSLISTVEAVRGVRDVENRLEAHKQPGDVPALQGGAPRQGRRRGVTEQYWSPTTRLWTGVAGGGLLMWCMARRDLPGMAAGLFGTGLLARSLTNLEAKRLTGIGAGRKAVNVQKTINIDALIDRVFGFFSDYQNFPRFMSNVREVRDHASGRSHWVVAGPMGASVEWDADLTQYVVNHVIAWKSVAGAAVQNAGVVKFQQNDDGSTRVDIKLSYNPPGGALGHALARLFGADPKSEMDPDLARVKTFLETGHPPHDAARPVHTDAPAHAEAS